MEENKFTIYTDGSCDNLRYPNYGGWSYLILEDGKEIERKSGNEIHTTNNRMEMIAIINAISELPIGSKVEIFSDSKYSIYAFTHKPNYYAKNLDMIDSFFSICEERMLDVKFTWIKGHSGDKYNEIVDEMANDEFEKASGTKITDFKRLKTDKEYKNEVLKDYKVNARNKMLIEIITDIINDDCVKNEKYIIEKVNEINCVFKVN